MNKEKLLIVSWGVYPMAAGSAMVVDNMARHFSQDEIVLVGEKAPNLMQEKDDIGGRNIYYVNPNIRLLGKGQKYLRWLNFGRTVRKIRAIAIKESCSAILGVFPDEFYMYVAYRLSKQLKLPFYTWFHNTYMDNRTGVFKLVAKLLQPKFFSTAEVNFVISDGMIDFYKQRYPEFSFKALPHGFDIPETKYEPYTPNRRDIRFLFSGNLSESCRDATVRQIKTIIRNPNYHVHLSTSNPISDFEKYDICGDNVHYEGFVTWEEFERRLTTFDIMLLPHGFDGERTEVEYETIFPTRTIPLLYSNRPILAHTPKNVFLTRFLRKHDCAEIVDEKDEQAIEAAIERLLNDDQRRRQIIKNAMKTASLFDGKNTSRQLKQAVFKHE